MESKTNACKVIAVTHQILFGNIENKDDLKTYGLDEHSFTLAKGLFPKQLLNVIPEKENYFDDLSVPGSHARIYIDPSGNVPLGKENHVQKTALFFEKLGFNVADIKSEIDKNENGDGEYKTVGFDISSAWEHWNISYLNPSDVDTKDLANYTLGTVVRYLRNYPEDFTEKDFEVVIDLLNTLGEKKIAQILDLTLKSEQVKKESSNLLNVYQIQLDYLNKYFKGNSCSDDYYEYEWYFEVPMNPTMESIFKPDSLVIQYTDKSSGALSGTTLDTDRLFEMDIKDFNAFVNECIHYDPVMEFTEETIEK